MVPVTWFHCNCLVQSKPHGNSLFLRSLTQAPNHLWIHRWSWVRCDVTTLWRTFQSRSTLLTTPPFLRTRSLKRHELNRAKIPVQVNLCGIHCFSGESTAWILDMLSPKRAVGKKLFFDLLSISLGIPQALCWFPSTRRRCALLIRHRKQKPPAGLRRNGVIVVANIKIVLIWSLSFEQRLGFLSVSDIWPAHGYCGFANARLDCYADCCMRKWRRIAWLPWER